MPPQRCQARRQDGKKCQANTIDGEHCLFHSQSARHVRARERGRRVGGTLAHVQRKKLLLPESAPDVELREPADIREASERDN